MDTTLAHADGDPFSRHGAVNPPVYRASTILYPTVGEYEAARDPARRFDVVRYGHILKARQLVGVRGAGLAYDGLYYVKSVTHKIKRGEYKQSFELSRNGLISTVPRVAA